MILALALALASSQVDYSPLVRVRDASAARVRGREGVSFAFFEFAPASGAGVGSVAPYPNWVSYSEQLDNAAWTSQFAPSAITVTANASGAMERLQIPATTGAQYALLYQNAAVVLAGPLTISADVRGVGGTSGTFKLGVFNGVLFYYGDCAFTAALTRCSVSVSFPAPTLTRIYLGNDSANIVGNPAQAAVDVYVGSVQLNVGSTTAPYIATTTTAAGYMPTGAKGEAMTFARTGTAMATRTASGGLATSGIANGDLVLMPANAPRVEYDSAGTLGLLVESARTNSLLRSEALDNAAWTTVGTAMTVTADYAVAPDGTTTAERLQIPATSGAGISMRAQTGLGAAAMTGSCFVKGNLGTSGTLDMYQSGVSLSCGGCAFNGTTWTRCSLTAGAAVTTWHIGNDSGDCGSAARSAVDVLVWGCQSETGAYATSYIPTTSAAVTRNADLAYFALTGAPGFTVGSMAASINPNSAMSYATPVATATLTAPLGSGADQLVLYANGTSGASYKCYAGNTAATLAVTGAAAFVAPANGPHRGYCAAGGIGGTLTGGFDTNSMSASAAIPAGPYGAENYLFVGSGNNTITYVDSIVSRICRDPIATRCR